MYAVRRWSTRNAGSLDRIYRFSATLFHALDPVWRRIGVQRLEKPFSATEAWVKGMLFDCQMCGRCTLSVTGMTCPANCPKSIRNGPCGGVRSDGHCEVKPEMRCVWVEAWEGAKRMRDIEPFCRPLPPREHNIEGSSAWLRLVAENGARRESPRPDAAAKGHPA
jgi:Methylene-tetrahydrofolate reductase C terminal